MRNNRQEWQLVRLAYKEDNIASLYYPQREAFKALLISPAIIHFLYRLSRLISDRGEGEKDKKKKKKMKMKKKKKPSSGHHEEEDDHEVIEWEELDEHDIEIAQGHGHKHGQEEIKDAVDATVHADENEEEEEVEESGRFNGGGLLLFCVESAPFLSLAAPSSFRWQSGKSTLGAVAAGLRKKVEFRFLKREPQNWFQFSLTHFEAIKSGMIVGKKWRDDLSKFRVSKIQFHIPW